MRNDVVAILGIILLTTACSGEPSQGHEGRVAEKLIGGVPDTTHPAVVATIEQNDDGRQTGFCTGTIVGIDSATHIGYVLTAAHCVKTDPDEVILGDDRTAPDAKHFRVIDYKQHPKYGQTSQTGHIFDFGIIRIENVDDSIPVIPVLRPSDDTLAAGTPLLAVGYGCTSMSSRTNVIRRQLDVTVGRIIDDDFTYPTNNSGLCPGDSGGPLLFRVNEMEYVAGIGWGYGGKFASVSRVSHAVDWIDSVVVSSAPQGVDAGAGPSPRPVVDGTADEGTDPTETSELHSDKESSPKSSAAASCVVARVRGCNRLGEIALLGGVVVWLAARRRARTNK